MRSSMIRGLASRRIWRPVLGLMVAYAVAAQSLLIALGGFALPAHAGTGAPGFELCLHDGQTAPAEPADNPGPGGCSHCIFCFAGSHHALIGSPPALFHRMTVAIVSISWAADKSALPRLSPYAIANPRGPPPGA